MFERFTGRARQVVILGQDEARSLGHGHIGTEHILLGLLREEEGIAARVLESMDVRLDDVRNEIVATVGRGDVVATGQIPFTPHAQNALELSLREALALGHSYIGTEHILLGLVREKDGVAGRILAGRSADAERVRRQVIRILSGAGRHAHAAHAPEHAPVELTSPPLAPELLFELEHLAEEKSALVEAKDFENATRLAWRETRLREPAEQLVRAWREHTTGRA